MSCKTLSSFTSSEPQYVVDDMALQHGFTVVHLPPYPCVLNLIELIWCRVKRHVSEKHTTFKIADVKHRKIKLSPLRRPCRKILGSRQCPKWSGRADDWNWLPGGGGRWRRQRRWWLTVPFTFAPSFFSVTFTVLQSFLYLAIRKNIVGVTACWLSVGYPWCLHDSPQKRIFLPTARILLNLKWEETRTSLDGTKNQNSANTCQSQIQQGKLSGYRKLPIIHEQTIVKTGYACPVLQNAVCFRGVQGRFRPRTLSLQGLRFLSPKASDRHH